MDNPFIRINYLRLHYAVPWTVRCQLALVPSLKLLVWDTKMLSHQIYVSFKVLISNLVASLRKSWTKELVSSTNNIVAIIVASVKGRYRQEVCDLGHSLTVPPFLRKIFKKFTISTWLLCDYSCTCPNSSEKMK